MLFSPKSKLLTPLFVFNIHQGLIQQVVKVRQHIGDAWHVGLVRREGHGILLEFDALHVTIKGGFRKTEPEVLLFTKSGVVCVDFFPVGVFGAQFFV